MTPPALMMLGARLVLAILAAETEVLVDKEFACARVASGQDGETNDNTFLLP
jgi:hypothetical protein